MMTDIVENLLPCPFCGSDDIDAAFAMWGDGTVSPGCMSCGGSAGTQEAWNARAPAQSAWQPTETAPKDGTKILLRDPLDDTVVVGFWSKGEDNGKACWRLCWDHAPFGPYYDAAVWAHLPSLSSA